MNYRDGQKQQVLSENSSLFYVVFTWWCSCSSSLIVSGWVSCLHTNICETQRCASFQLHYLILLVFTTMKNTTHNMAPVLSAVFTLYAAHYYWARQTNKHVWIQLWFVCMCQSFGFLSLYSERQCRALQEMWEKEKRTTCSEGPQVGL